MYITYHISLSRSDGQITKNSIQQIITGHDNSRAHQIIANHKSETRSPHTIIHVTTKYYHLISYYAGRVASPTAQPAQC